MSYEQQVWNGWTAGVVLLVSLVIFFVLSHRSEDHGPTLLARWITYFVMLREQRSALVRGRAEPVRGGGSTGSDDPVLPHQNQVEPVELADVEPGREPLVLHNLSRAALIALLSVQKNDSNGYRFSKNQIAAFVGGTKADVLKEIDLYRDPQPQKPRSVARADRPVNGWN